VNLQRPFRRTELGFETMDLVLDLIVDPDGSWRWKDEDELATWVARGVFEPELAERIRAEGESVLARAPWPTGWEKWRPDPAWELPELPDGWDVRQ
jgi:predicted RNA-binding protein associated with RNAse of E/G family